MATSVQPSGLEALITQLLHQQEENQKLLLNTLQPLIQGLLQMQTTQQVPTFPSFDEASEDWEGYESRLLEHFHAFKVTDASLMKSLFLSWSKPEIYRLLCKLAPLSKPSELTFSDIRSLLTKYYQRHTHVILFVLFLVIAFTNAVNVRLK